MNRTDKSWIGALLGAGLLWAGAPSGGAQAQYPNCNELGSALVDHACFHATMGPFVDVAASSARDFSAANPNINPVHTQYNVTLPTAAEGTVKYRPQRAGDWTIMTDTNVSLTVLDAGGSSLSPVLEGSVSGCSALLRQRVYTLQANETYRLVLGADSDNSVSVVIEKLADFETAYFADADGDSYGDTNAILSTGCAQPAGYVTNEDDCDDTVRTVSPGAAESCGDGVDNNCDGQTDEDCGPVCEPVAEVCDGADNDCDGEIDDGVLNVCGQCGAVPAEACDDQIDNDCDGEVDEGCTPQCVPSSEVCDGEDNDCDGQVDNGVLNACGECGVVPSEVCDDQIDNDCDGEADEGCAAQCVPSDEVCDGADNDCDDETDEGVENACGECGEVPAEVCDDQIDNDCDGEVDEGCSSACQPNEEVCDNRDNDCDGEVDNGVLNACGECGEVPAEVCNDGLDNDCDGTADEDCGASCEPAEEVCDGLDNDCDGLADEDVQNACGECGKVPTEACGDQVDNDCDGLIDEDCTGNCEPAEELCDGVDNDCDGEIDQAAGESVCGCGAIDLEVKRKRYGKSDAVVELERTTAVSIPAEVHVTGDRGCGGKVSLTFGTAHRQQDGRVRRTFTCTYRPDLRSGNDDVWKLRSCDGNRNAGDSVDVEFLRLRITGGRKAGQQRAHVAVQDLSCR